MSIFNELNNLDIDIKDSLEQAETFNELTLIIGRVCDRLTEERRALREDRIQLRELKSEMELQKRETQEILNALIKERTCSIKKAPEVKMEKPKKKKPQEPKGTSLWDDLGYLNPVRRFFSK